MPIRETIAIYCDDCNTNPPCAPNAEFLSFPDAGTYGNHWSLIA